MMRALMTGRNLRSFNLTYRQRGLHSVLNVPRGTLLLGRAKTMASVWSCLSRRENPLTVFNSGFLWSYPKCRPDRSTSDEFAPEDRKPLPGPVRLVVISSLRIVALTSLMLAGDIHAQIIQGLPVNTAQIPMPLQVQARAPPRSRANLELNVGQSQTKKEKSARLSLRGCHSCVNLLRIPNRCLGTNHTLACC
jgi:hypothetical protein